MGLAIVSVVHSRRGLADALLTTLSCRPPAGHPDPSIPPPIHPSLALAPPPRRAAALARTKAAESLALLDEWQAAGDATVSSKGSSHASFDDADRPSSSSSSSESSSEEEDDSDNSTTSMPARWTAGTFATAEAALQEPWKACLAEGGLPYARPGTKLWTVSEL